jgi:hypothetical protein
MPYEIIPLGKRGHYQVINSVTGEVHAKDTTLKNAKAQVRLLYSLEKKGGGPSQSAQRGPTRPPTLQEALQFYRRSRTAFNNDNMNGLNIEINNFMNRYDLNNDSDNYMNLSDAIREIVDGVRYVYYNRDILVEQDFEVPANYEQVLDQASNALAEYAIENDIELDDNDVANIHLGDTESETDEEEEEEDEGEDEGEGEFNPSNSLSAAGFSRSNLQPVNYSASLKNNFF